MPATKNGNLAYDAFVGDLVHKNGKRLHITAQVQRRLLYILWNAPGRVFSADDLIRELGRGEMSQDSLQVQLGRVRRHLRNIAGEEVSIKNVRNEGFYLFVAS